MANAINYGHKLSDDDLALAQFHVANGTALGFSFKNAIENQQSQQQRQQNSPQNPEEDKKVSLTKISKLINEMFGSGSITKSGKKVTKPALDLISDLNKQAETFYNIAYEFASDSIPWFEKDERGENLMKTMLDPETIIEIYAESFGFDNSDEEFNARAKNGKVGTYTYEKEGLEAVANLVLSITIQRAYNDRRKEEERILKRSIEKMKRPLKAE